MGLLTLQYFENAGLAGVTWDSSVTTSDSNYYGSFVFSVSNNIQNGIKLSTGYFFEANGGLHGLDTVSPISCLCKCLGNSRQQ